MKLLFGSKAWADYVEWQDDDPEMVGRINDLVKDAMRHPFKGIGKPEPLRRSLSGWWSRRITREHRLVYRVGGSGDEQTLEILSCRYHYQ